MSGERGYEQGSKGRKDYAVKATRTPNSRAGRAMARQRSYEEQRARDFDRALEGKCPGCGHVLEGEVTVTPEFGPMHDACAIRSADPHAPENVDDDGEFLDI